MNHFKNKSIQFVTIYAYVVDEVLLYKRQLNVSIISYLGGSSPGGQVDGVFYALRSVPTLLTYCKRHPAGVVIVHLR